MYFEDKPNRSLTEGKKYVIEELRMTGRFLT